MEEDNALNGPTKQAPWITFNGVNHGDSQVESLQDLNFIFAFNLYNFDTGSKINLIFLSVREHSIMTSHICVGRGVQDSPKKGTLESRTR